MDKELLKLVALFYFKDKVGAEPETLIITHADDDAREYFLDATLGERNFQFWMNPGANLIALNEKHPAELFTRAAALAGLDRNLEPLKSTSDE